MKEVTVSPANVYIATLQNDWVYNTAPSLSLVPLDSEQGDVSSNQLIDGVVEIGESGVYTISYWVRGISIQPNTTPRQMTCLLIKDNDSAMQMHEWYTSGRFSISGTRSLRLQAGDNIWLYFQSNNSTTLSSSASLQLVKHNE
jgi:hypothetical protein